MRFFGLAVGLAASVACSAPALAENYPSQVVRIIAPIAAGGPVDMVARAVAETLSERLKQPFIVENRPGAGGNIGIQAGAAAKPDGYTLIIATGSMLTTNPLLYKEPPFRTLTDLRPIATLTASSQTLAAHPSLPVNSLDEFIRYAKDKPVEYATSGYGTPSHLTMEYLGLLAGFKATPVTYRGVSPLMVDLLAGHIKIGFAATAAAVGPVQDGKLKALAVSSRERSQILKDVPTIVEAGYPEFSVDSYLILAAPAGTPDQVAALLEKEARRAVTLPGFQEKFRTRDLVGIGVGSAETRAWIEKELKRWSKIIEDADMAQN